MDKPLHKPINVGNKSLDVVVVSVREYGYCTDIKNRIDVIVKRLKKAAATHDQEL